MTKNTHMTHLEDKVLYGGVDGTRQAIVAVRELKNLLRSDQSGSVSVKWDGAPSRRSMANHISLFTLTLLCMVSLLVQIQQRPLLQPRLASYGTLPMKATPLKLWKQPLV